MSRIKRIEESVIHRGRVVLTLETSEVSATFVSTTKTTRPRPQIFSVMVP